MNVSNGLRLSAYMGERDHVAGRLACDVLLDAWAKAGVGAGVLLRGVEGFGLRHRLHTEQLLTLSEDLPVVAVAFDERGRIEELVEPTLALMRHGLTTLEPTALLGGERAGEELELTLLGDRGAPYVDAVEALRHAGLAGARVLLGVDGVVHGERLRARFLRRNMRVPVLMSGVGAAAAIARVLASPPQGFVPLALTPVRICKRDGALLARPPEPPVGTACWQQLVVQTGERDVHERRPVHGALVRRLRHEGAAGATALRALWGYGGEHPPHGERMWSLTRDVPVCTVVCDTPDAIQRWFDVVDELTAGTGLVTSALVPELRAAAPGGIEHGGLSVRAGGAAGRPRSPG
jgi:PII-like signaling protein